MYCDFYGFKEKPFIVTPNPRFVFLSKNHKEAFAHLLYGIDNHAGFIALTGEVGTGKTTVLRTLLGQLDDATFRSALILNPCLSAPELLRSINREFGITWEGLNSAELLDTLNCFLLAENHAGRTVVLVIDEAQNLEPLVLEQIRLISNLETETDKLIQIILAGQPELTQILQKPELRQFGQRITVRYHLSSMDFDDTRAYIEHRLEVAGGWRAATFTKRAMKNVFSYSRGIPRLINIVCDRALLIGYIDENREISGRMASRAIAEISERRKSSAIIRLALGAGLPLILSVAGVMYAFLHKTPARFPLPPRVVHTVIASPVVDDADPEELPVILRKTLWGMGEADSAANGFNSLAKIWNARPLTGQATVQTPRELEKAAEERGLYLARFNGSLNRMLSADSPALMEIRLSGNGGRRYLALIGRENDRFIVSPPLKGRASLSRVELESLWSGRAYLPWQNFLNIPRLTPGMKGEAVTRLQKLLQEAGVYKGGLTGVYDRETTAAIKAFQSAHGIVKNGRPGKQTLFFLYRKVNRFSAPRLEKKGGDHPE
ncbi:MAG TPA: AAA family ATPase [Geobacteraceae bacterium]|nr:AAA family ATPase [Geobacteraceae bacterium]